MSASLPVPNDDPSCHCSLSGPGVVSAPPEFVLVFARNVGEAGGDIAVLYDPACPHHGALIRALQVSHRDWSVRQIGDRVQAQPVPVRDADRNGLIRLWRQQHDDMWPAWRVDPLLFVDWVEQNLGPRPSSEHWLARRYVNDLWAPGNIEWECPASAASAPAPTYHDLHVTAPGIERTSIFNLPYGLQVMCGREAGWQLWDMNGGFTNARIIAGEYDGPDKWLVLDVAGHVIVDSRNRPREDDDGEHRQAAAEDRTGTAGGTGPSGEAQRGAGGGAGGTGGNSWPPGGGAGGHA